MLAERITGRRGAQGEQRGEVGRVHEAVEQPVDARVVAVADSVQDACDARTARVGRRIVSVRHIPTVRDGRPAVRREARSHSSGDSPLPHGRAGQPVASGPCWTVTSLAKWSAVVLGPRLCWTRLACCSLPPTLADASATLLARAQSQGHELKNTSIRYILHIGWCRCAWSWTGSRRVLVRCLPPWASLPSRPVRHDALHYCWPFLLPAGE
jgi:hypothetical protein